MSPEKWSVLDHACRICFGRLLLRQENGIPIVKCVECGETLKGSHLGLCCCGVTLHSGANAGLRCVPNDRKTPEQPQEIVIRHTPQEAVAKMPARRSVREKESDW